MMFENKLLICDDFFYSPNPDFMYCFKRKWHLRLIAAFVFSSFIFWGCLTPAKVDGYISDGYSGLPRVKNNDYIILATQHNIGDKNIISVTKKDKGKVLPLILYWKFQSSVTSTLSQSVPFSYFNSTLMTYANTKGLKQKLNGQRIELSMDKLPAIFSYTSVEHLIYLGIWYVHWGSVFVQPQNQDVTISYRLLNNTNEETKKGTITIKDLNQRMYLKMFHYSAKKFIWRYLDKYNSNLQAMSKEFVDKLIVEL